jgi:hypothetical protein
VVWRWIWAKNEADFKEFPRKNKNRKIMIFFSNESLWAILSGKIKKKSKTAFLVALRGLWVGGAAGKWV